MSERSRVERMPLQVLADFCELAEAANRTRHTPQPSNSC